MKKLLLCLIITTFSLSAHADQIFGDFKRLPDEIERGFSVGADFGMMVLTSSPRDVANPGFQLALNLGIDISKYIGISIINVLSINEASPDDSALQGGVNTYIHELALKLQYPLKRLYPFVEAGGGVFYSKPGFNFDNDSYKMTMLLGGGIEYYTFLRHYSLYVKSLYHIILDNSDFNAWSLSGGIKYTF